MSATCLHPPVRTGSFRPAFIIGITGNSDPQGYRDEKQEKEAPSVTAIRETFFSILDWVRGKKWVAGTETDCPAGWLNPLTHRFETQRRCEEDSAQEFHSQWLSLNLGNTPIIVLSSLAPGIDTLVAEAAMDYAKERDADVIVRAALPFPLEIYEGSSTFRPAEDLDSETAAEWERKKGRLHSVVERIKAQVRRPLYSFPGDAPQNVFLEERDLFDVLLDAGALEKFGGSDPSPGDHESNKNHRNLHYRAAGEYVAAYGDILVAFYDEVHARSEADRAKGSGGEERTDWQNPFVPGTHAIVEVKRRGLTDGLLPIPSSISWADGGPVLHVPMDRAKNCPPAVEGAPLRPLRLLHPLDALPDQERKKGSEDPRNQEAGDQLLRLMAANLSRFYQDISHADDEIRIKALKDLDKNPAGSLLSKMGPEAVMHTRHCKAFPFQDFSVFRDWVAAVSRGYDAQVKRWQAQVFLLGSVSLFFFIISGSDFRNLLGLWVCGLSDTLLGKPADCAAVEAWAKNSAIAFFFFGIGLCIYTWNRNRRFREQDVENRQFDYRVIAEGLRVQFFWSVSGLCCSAASRYIHRLRGELSWIRSALGSSVFPYQRTRSWFKQLSAKEQADVLKGVHRSWIQNQLQYFTSSANDAAKKRDILNALGLALTVAGALLAIYTIFVENLPPFPGIHFWRGELRFVSLLVLLACFFSGITRHWIQRRAQELKGEEPGKESCWSWTVWCNFIPLELLDRWLPTPAAVQKFSPVVQRLGALLLGVNLMIFITLSHDGDYTLEWWLKLWKAGAFAISGLVLLWIERNFFEEHHRRYDAMQKLFHGAEQRLRSKLKNLDAALLSAHPPVAPDLIIRDIQELLTCLGHEALAENAEWAVLRRSRIIEAHPPAW